ncbi:MAG: multiheme c-type cytochrome [Thermoguttaceae bacterium]
MLKPSPPGFVAGAVTAAVGFACLVVTIASAQPPPLEQTPEPAPPPGQTYVGTNRCASCHFKQYMVWKKTKHPAAFTDMPAKYQSDAKCLACHVTGYGAKGGYVAGTSPEVLKELLGVTCEACHGPGSEHEKIAKQFVDVKKLSTEQEKAARGSIYKIQPNNVCVRCHVTPQGHQEHPKYDKQ